MPRFNDNPNRMNSAQEVINRLRVQPEVVTKAYIVGSWVWITFDSKPSDEIRSFLKLEGFIWSKRRSAWLHCGGHPSTKANYDPRTKYGIVRPALSENELEERYA